MGIKVLTVDDSKTIRMVVKKALQPFDCEVFEGENGAEGLELAGREKPDLIVLDITMPVMDGKEMLAKLKADAALKDIPVIMLTAESGKNNVIQILKLGVKDYMVKPFKGEELIERAGKIVTLQPKSDAGEDKSKESKAGSCLVLQDGIHHLVLPAAADGNLLAEIAALLKDELSKSGGNGGKKLVFDLSQLSKTNISVIKLIITATEKCAQTRTHLRVVGNANLAEELKGFQETAELSVYENFEAAKAAL